MTAHRERRARLIDALPDTVDAVLVTALVNVRYLCGFTGSNGALLVSRDNAAVFATDGRYLLQAAAEVPDLECVESRAVGPELVRRAVEQGARRLAIEATNVSIAVRDRLSSAAAERLELVACADLVEQLRRVKDSREIASIERACGITDRAFAAMVEQLRAGLTERDVAWLLQSAIRDNGGDGLAFDSIVAFGPNSAIPHHQPTDRQLAPGDLVKCDFGALSEGYHADMTRTVVLGPAALWQVELHQLVSDIQRECRLAVAPGVLPAALDTKARDLVEAAGYPVRHGLGHGVGLEIHELPFLTPGSSDAALEADSLVTVEPGVYIDGRGGVRIEDTMVVGDQGTRELTQSSRALIEA